MKHKGYTNSEGVRVPSVTTVTGRYKESGGLIHWAYTEGLAGRDYRETRDAAATAGHVCHDMIECDIHGRSWDGDVDADTLKKAETGYAAFRQWSEQTRLEPVHTEVAMVSEALQVGGRLDLVAYCGGDLTVVDWKTSNGVYQDYIIQGAAYIHIWNELHPEDPVTGTLHLLRIGKEHADFHHHSWPESVTSMAWESFKLMRRLYDIDKELKKVVK